MSSPEGLVGAIARARTSEELKLRVMSSIPEQLGVDGFAIYLFNAGRDRAAEIYFRGVSERFICEYERLARHEDRLLAQVVETRRSMRDEDAYPRGAWKRSLLYREFASAHGIRHVLCAPVVAGGELLGILHMGRSHDDARFSAGEAQRVATFCEALARKLVKLQQPADERQATESSAWSVERLARLRADRIQLRTRLAAVEQASTQLGDEEARELFRALSHGEITPIDAFNHNGRRYLLVPRPNFSSGARLSGREEDVVRHAVPGNSNKVIAYELGISSSAVASYLSSAMSKLGVRSRVQLAKVFRRRTDESWRVA